VSGRTQVPLFPLSFGDDHADGVVDDQIGPAHAETGTGRPGSLPGELPGDPSLHTIFTTVVLVQSLSVLTAYPELSTAEQLVGPQQEMDCSS